MGDREQPQAKFLTRRTAGRALALTSAALLATSAVFVPSSAQASLNKEYLSEITSDKDEFEEESGFEQLDSEALVIEEEEDELLKLSLGADPNCRAQFRATAQKILGDPNKSGFRLEPLPDRTYQATGFVRQKKTIKGVSTANGSGDILFTADMQKRPARVVEFKGRSDENNKMPITVAREGGAARSALVPCGYLKHFPFRSLFKKS